MSQPTTYIRAFNFQNQQAVTPSDPIRADKLDLELNLVKTSLDETQANLALIQRDDGAVMNGTIGYDQLKAELNGFGFNPPEPWLTATNYIARDTVFAGSGFYQCITSHISGVFATDLAAGKWLLVADFTSATTAAAASAAAALVSQNAAAGSATAASGSATTATGAASTATTAAGTSTTNAGLTAADVIAAEADKVQTGQDRIATAADVVLTHADVVTTTADRIAAAASAVLAQTFAFAVSYVAQVLTAAQKLVARTNIEASHVNDARPSLIVNGSMQDSPENGTTLGTVNGYFPAEMWALYFTASTAAMSVQLISTRTLSGNDRAIEFKTTTAKASLGASDFVSLTTIIEGSRPEFKAAAFGTAGAKPFVHRFEETLPAGLYHWRFSNSAGNLNCVVPFTVSAPEANVATVKSVVVPAFTSGTWLFADGDKGLVAELVLAAGATLTGGAASTWGATVRFAASTQFNILSSTSNVARIADVGLKNDPDATAVYGLFRVGEKDATYRSERYWQIIFVSGGGYQPVGNVDFQSNIVIPVKMPFVPAISTLSTIGSTGISGTSYGFYTLFGFRLTVTGGATAPGNPIFVGTAKAVARL